MPSEKREELGRLSTNELGAQHESGENDIDCECPYCLEWEARYYAFHDGSPGAEPMLSRAQVVAVLGPLMKQKWYQGRRGFDAELRGIAVGIDACARALLALDSDAPSPLEDTDDD